MKSTTMMGHGISRSLVIFTRRAVAVTMIAQCLTIGSSALAGQGKSHAVLQKAVFAKSLSKNQEPGALTDRYMPSDTIYLSLQFKGRPSSGVVSTKFYISDHLISEASVDLAGFNKGIVFSIGQSTFTGFSLKPTKPFPVSDLYRADSFLDGKALGTYKFKVVPPADAIPSKILEAVLAKDVTKDRTPIGVSTVFAASQKVCLVVKADIGSGTNLEVNWYVNGKLDPDGTKSLSAGKNISATRFFFSFLPAHGWSAGKHEAVLMMNGHEAGRYGFTTK